MKANDAIQMPAAHTRSLIPDAKVIMVNGTFLLPSNWEKVAGQTWSTRPYCRPQIPRSITQTIEITPISRLARLSL
jgi:hypothetical protein